MPIIYRGKRQLKVRVLGLALGVAAAAALCWLAWTVGRPAPEPPPPGQSLPEEKSPAPLPEQDPSSPAETYDFTRPAPERAPVDNSYFQNAAFVGDSRTDGFLIYSGIGTGKNLTSNGLSIFKLGEKKALTIDGEKYTSWAIKTIKAFTPATAPPSTRSAASSPRRSSTSRD